MPLPTVIKLSPIVGLFEVPQHMPLDSIEAPPSSVMFPPEIAVVRVIPVTLSVVRTGRFAPFLLQELMPVIEHIRRILITVKILLFETISVFTIVIIMRIKHKRFHLVHYSCC